MMKRLLFSLALLLTPLAAQATPPGLNFACPGGTGECGDGKGNGWYLDTRPASLNDLYYLKSGLEILKLAHSGTTLTLSSDEFATLSLPSDGLLVNSLSVTGTSTFTGAQTFTGAATFNSTVSSKYFSIDFQAMPTTTGVGLTQSDWTAYDSTAATLNVISTGYGALYGMTIVDAGNSVPVLDASGLDITAGNVTDDDHVSYWSHWGPGEDRAFVAETDGAVFCVDMTVTDVTGTDAHYCGFRSLDPVTVAIASYTDYCAIGHISGNYGTQDKTTGATDSGADAIADTEEDTWCITLAAATGVCTYTIDGVAVASADTHDFAAGTPLVPFCQAIHTADGAEDTILGTWNVTKP